jgi:hypothetical protein
METLQLSEAAMPLHELTHAIFLQEVFNKKGNHFI